MAKHCIDIEHSEVQKLSKELNLHPAIIATKVAIWQESNDEIGKRFPKSEDLLIKSTENIKVIPENISSKGSEFAKKLTNVGNNVGLIYKGKEYVNSEHAYQTWKSGEFNQQGYNLKGGKVRGGKIGDTFSIMTDILTEKLKQHPELVKGIDERGGLAYIQQSTHNVTGDKFWESTGQNKFIKALAEAYKNIASNQIPQKQISQKQIISNTSNKSILKRIVNDYFKNKQASDILSKLQNLQQLIKGFNNNFGEAESFISTLNDLGYSINEDFTDIVPNKEKTDKFYKNYKNTSDNIDGVDKILLGNDNPFFRQSIKTALQLIKVSEKFFINQTPIAKEVITNLSSLFKEHVTKKSDFRNDIRKKYLAFLTVSAYRNKFKNNDTLKLPHIKDFLLTKLEDIQEDDTRQFNDLQNSLLEIIQDYKNKKEKNPFVNFLEIKNIDHDKQKNSLLYGYRQHLLTINSRALKDPKLIQELISGFNELYFANNNNIDASSEAEIRMNNIKSKFARDLFNYLILKDGLLYENQSFIKAIDPVLFKKISTILDDVQDLFQSKDLKHDDFIKLFDKSKRELEVDFMLKYGFHQNNLFDLNSQLLSALLSTSKEDIKTKEEEIEKIDTDYDEIDNELIEQDTHLFWKYNDSNTFVINGAANVKKTDSTQDKKDTYNENKKSIFRKAGNIIKPVIVNNFTSLGFPLMFYVNTKTSKIPLKLKYITSTLILKEDNIKFYYTISSEGKIINYIDSKKSLDGKGIMMKDLMNHSIFNIIENLEGLKKDKLLTTYNSNTDKLLKLAKELKKGFQEGVVAGTKAEYEEHSILGSKTLSSLADDINSQLEIKLNNVKIDNKKSKISIFNKTNKTKVDETKIKENLIKEYTRSKNDGIEYIKFLKDESIESLESALKTQLLIENPNETMEDILERIEKCKGQK